LSDALHQEVSFNLKLDTCDIRSSRKRRF